MDIGGGKSGAVSGAMNMLGNLGSAFSAIIFPYFVAHVTLPWLAEQPGTANSFFLFAAAMNVAAAGAWLFMDPRRKVAERISPAQVRIRLAFFVVVAGLLVGVPLIYKLLFMSRNREIPMLTRREYRAAQEHAVALIRAAGLALTDEEAGRVEVADFGLSRLDREGAQILTWVATDRIAVKIIALFEDQSLPEHWHPRVGADPGKEETIRVVHGVLRCYIPGVDTLQAGFVPEGKQEAYSTRQEHLLGPGAQITLAPGTKHWFQAGAGGVVMYSFSTVARDILDQFTDPNVQRVTRITD